MNKTLSIVSIVVALVVGVVAGHFLFPTAGGIGSATITPYNCLNQQILCNELQSIANPLTGWNASSTSWTPVALGNVGASTSTTSTVITVTGATLGDYLEYGESAPITTVGLSCAVTATNTVTCTKQSFLTATSTVTSTIYVLDLPRTTFVSPSGL